MKLDSSFSVSPVRSESSSTDTGAQDFVCTLCSGLDSSVFASEGLHWKDGQGACFTRSTLQIRLCSAQRVFGTSWHSTLESRTVYTFEIPNWYNDFSLFYFGKRSILSWLLEIFGL
jgi:hypothetical protein